MEALFHNDGTFLITLAIYTYIRIIWIIMVFVKGFFYIFYLYQKLECGTLSHVNLGLCSEVIITSHIRFSNAQIVLLAQNNDNVLFN